MFEWIDPWAERRRTKAKFDVGEWVNYEVSAEVAGVRLAQTVKFCIVGVALSSNSERQTFTYDLSRDPPQAYHYGSGVQFTAVEEERLIPLGVDP